MSSMWRIALGVRYDGARYHGWQSQDGLPTIQLFVEKAVSFVANHSINVVCAGRTDAGVHATCQVVHFDTDVDRTESAWVFGSNSNLPHDITILWAKIVPVEFHARFTAVARKYRYVIYNNKVRPGILRHAVGWYHRDLDVEKMQEAANYLLGKHDFSSFRGSGCQAKGPVRDLQSLVIQRRGKMVIIEAQANAFLLHMVRNLVGVLLAVGCGAKPPCWSENVLKARDRTQASVTFSPNGLYLVGVEYPLVYDFPINTTGPFFLS
jgi:tRNA pseudouridine38-40 synthase